MNDLFADILMEHTVLSEVVPGIALIFIRIGAAVATLPGFAEQSIPMRVRVVLALCLTLALAPDIFPTLQDKSIWENIISETVTGLALGLVLRMFIFALETAGSIAANATSLAQMFPAGAEAQPALSRLLIMAALAVSMQADLPLHMMSYFLVSYDIFPVEGFSDGAFWARNLIEKSTETFQLAFRLSLPFLAGSLLYNLALGFINRAMPQLMVTLIGAPALALGSIVMMAIFVPILLSAWLDAFHIALSSTPWGVRGK